MKKGFRILAVLLAGSLGPVACATNHWVRLDFEELGDEAALTNQYAAYGVAFEGIGVDTNQAFRSTMVAPIGNVDYTIAPPLRLTEILVGPQQTDFFQNIRYITFLQPQSRVFLVVNSGVNIPTLLRATIRAYDGTNGTGSEVIAPIILPEVIHELVVIDTGTNNIRSLTIQCVGNTSTFDELTFDAGTAPKGGYLEVSSSLDAATNPPAVFLGGTPSFLTEYWGTSPTNVISVSEGKHLVTLYTPGYEWHQELVDIMLGQTSVVNAVMVPVTEPVFDGASLLQANGATLNVGVNASPSLADWDADGRKDLVVGSASGNTLFYSNIGTDEVPVFDAGQVVLTNTRPNASPVMLDFYTDEKNDLVVGHADGKVEVLYNQGSRTTPDFSGSPYDSTLVTAPSSNAVPFLVDWDNDRKKDLLVGCKDGNVYLWLNQRLDASPDYTSATPTNVASVSSDAAPCAVLDWDGDGRKDLVVGNGAGYVNLFLNSGTDAAPVFTNSTRLQTKDGMDINVGSTARPLVVDYNGDQRKDLLIGRGDGRISLYLTPAPAQLSIELTSTNTVRVLWPSPSTGFVLEQNSDLTTTNWIASPEPVTDDGTNRCIVVDPPTSNRYYRLHKP